MKTFIGAIALVIVMWVAVINYDSTPIEYVKDETTLEVVEEVAEVDIIEKRIAEAQEKAMEDINAKADTMRGQFVANELKKIEAEVLAEIEKEIKTRRVDVEKQTGAYWRDQENVKALIRQTFPEAPNTAVEVARLETGFQMVQSKHIYTKDNPKLGIKAGERERSFCLFQIHEPAHKETIERLGLQDFKTNPESCVKMARVVYEQAGNSFDPWTVYKQTIAMR